jgi:hypothetical protein
MRIVNELPPSYHECIRTLAAKSQQNWRTLFELQRQRKYETTLKIPSGTTNENDRLNNNNNNVESTLSSPTNDVNAGNIVATSTAAAEAGNDANGNFILATDNDTLDMMNNGKGVIKLDMSRIIDSTGLPTYEAALKLKSSSYI